MHYVVVGGGIAGVACVEELLAVDPAAAITLVTASPVVKAVRVAAGAVFCAVTLCMQGALSGSLLAQASNVHVVSRTLETFSVQTAAAATLQSERTRIVCDTVRAIDAARHRVYLSGGDALPYDKLCVCTGAAPRLIVEHPLFLGLRDDEVSDYLVTRECCSSIDRTRVAVSSTRPRRPWRGCP
jgi:NADPH-dependent 2,4-dienoyl-CoA reductase/sulfur reductase-like enzyme